MPRAATVNDYIDAHPDWADTLTRLREILNATELEETIKWGAPCYTADNKNIVGLAAFKNHVGLWFHQGALLSDPEGVLTNAQEGKTKAMRHWRITTSKDIKARAIASIICSPPDSCPASPEARSRRIGKWSHSAAMSRPTSASRRRMAPIRRFSATVMLPKI